MRTPLQWRMFKEADVPEHTILKWSKVCKLAFPVKRHFTHSTHTEFRITYPTTTSTLTIALDITLQTLISALAQTNRTNTTYLTVYKYVSIQLLTTIYQTLISIIQLPTIFSIVSKVKTVCNQTEIIAVSFRPCSNGLC